MSVIDASICPLFPLFAIHKIRLRSSASIQKKIIQTIVLSPLTLFLDKKLVAPQSTNTYIVETNVWSWSNDEYLSTSCIFLNISQLPFFFLVFLLLHSKYWRFFSLNIKKSNIYSHIVLIFIFHVNALFIII